MTNTITYFSQNAPAGQEWMAYALLPNGQRWQVYAMAASEAEAVEKINSLYESERAKIKAADPWTAVNANMQELGKKIADGISVPTGRGSHFVGKVWLIHSFTRAKIRVDQSEVAKYMADGYERGGPRSK